MHIPIWVLRLLLVMVFLVIAAARRRRRETTPVRRPAAAKGARLGTPTAIGARPTDADFVSNKPLTPR